MYGGMNMGLNNRTLIMLAIIAMMAAAYWFVWKRSDQGQIGGVSAVSSGSAIVHVEVPSVLSAQSQLGAKIFDIKCVMCHGANGEGVDGVGPPLIHIYYEPNHHADQAFQLAVAQGVRQHHWTFGNMPPIEGLTRGDVAMITAYIREVQRANGID